MDIFENGDLTLLQIFKLGIKIMKKYSKEIVFLAILVYLPTSIILNFMNPKNFEMLTGLTIVVIIAAGLINLIYPLGIAYMINENFVKKEEINNLQVFMSALNKLPVAMVASIIMLGAIMVTSPLIIVPLVLVIYLSFINQAIIIKKCNHIQALSYSYKIVKGKWFRVFGKLVLFNLISFVFIIIVHLISLYIPYSIFTSSIISVVIGIINGFPLICTTILFYTLDKAYTLSKV